MTKFRSFLVAIFSFLFVAVIFWTTNNTAAQTSSSSLTGLVAMKEMAKQLVPYEVAVTNNKPTLLEFYADWCTTCQSMAPILSKLHQQYGDRVNFVMLDVDRPEWTSQLKKYRVTGIPQLTFLDSNQELVKTMVGTVPEITLGQVLDKLS